MAVLSSGRGNTRNYFFYIIAYAFPAAVVWGILGLVLQPLNMITLFMVLFLEGYALFLGVSETFHLPFRAPGLTWQVPAQWLKGRSTQVQTLIWGTMLGPGLITRNPYACMWVLPFLMILDHQGPMAFISGIAIGATHGVARALGVLSNRKHLHQEECSHLLVMGAQIYWRYVDGIALFLVTGITCAYSLFLFGLYY